MVDGAANAAKPASPIDAVYLWVDDRFPGFHEKFESYASNVHDHDPCRLRDNLDIIKYSLRSLAIHAPWIRHIYILSCAPQIPRWLAENPPGLTVVHHDAFIDNALLPTFNSFAISYFMARIPGLSRNVLCLDDDMVFGAPVTPADFADDSGRLRMYPRLRITSRPKHRHRDDITPWNASLSHANYLLDSAFGRALRHDVNHVPLLVNLDYWEEMIARWPEDFAHTRKSRFRAKYNVPPSHFYPYFLLATGRARMESFYRSYRDISYCALENSLLLTRLRLASAAARRPKIICFNDGFGKVPDRRVEALMRGYLERAHPKKSPYEA